MLRRGGCAGGPAAGAAGQERGSPRAQLDIHSPTPRRLPGSSRPGFAPARAQLGWDPAWPSGRGVGPCASPATVCVGRGGMWGWRAGLIHPGCPPSLEHPPFATGVVGSPCGQGEPWAGGAGVRAGRQEAAVRACAGRAHAHPAAGLQPPPGRGTAPRGVGQQAELRARPGQAERGALERGQVLVGVGHT